MEIAEYPPLYVSADAASGWGQRWHRRIFASNLVLILIGSALAFAATAIIDEPLRVSSAVVSAVALIAGVMTQHLHRLLRDDKSWFDGRAIAETVKSLTWRYMMGVPPYDDDVRAEALFTSALGDVMEQMTDVSTRITAQPGPHQITARMQEVRRLPFEERRALYAEERLEDQVRWYSAKSEFNRHRAAVWSLVSTAAQWVAIIAALLVVLSDNPWLNIVSVFGAVAAAATAWSQLGRHEELAKSYHVAAVELAKIQALTLNTSTEAELRDAVRSGEGAVSREHTLWIAKRGDSMVPSV